MVPSPPSATGTGTISPPKPASVSPDATRTVTSVADRLPLNLSGGTTTRSTMIRFKHAGPALVAEPLAPLHRHRRAVRGYLGHDAAELVAVGAHGDDGVGPAGSSFPPHSLARPG